MNRILFVKKYFKTYTSFDFSRSTIVKEFQNQIREGTYE